MVSRNMMPHYSMYIDGEFVSKAPNDDKAAITMQSINPATAQVWATFACADASDVEQAVVAARRALTSGEWSQLSATSRGKLLYRLADLIEQQATRIGEIETTDSGKLAVELRCKRLMSLITIATMRDLQTRSKGPHCQLISLVCTSSQPAMQLA